MTLNSNPKKIECPKIQTQKNRRTQDAMFVEVRINMKSHYDFMFVSTVCSSCKGFKCVTQKLEDPKKKLETCKTKKNSGNFAKPRKIAKKFANPEK